jgi:hypothetical protein
MSAELANAVLAFLSGLPVDPSVKPLVVGLGSSIALIAPLLVTGLVSLWLLREFKNFVRGSRG